MKKNITRVVFSLISFIMLLSSCEGTWIMYDTTQKDHLYMENLPTASTVSFALVADQELTHNVKVKMMGMPVDADRQFTVEFLEPSAASVASGENSIEVYKAVEGTDFEAPSFVLPAGAVETTLSFTLKRTETIKDKFASIRFRIVEDEEFIPMVQDSTDLGAIVSSEYEVLFNDGDPVCPVWWSAGAGYEGWQMLIGKFYVTKYRKFSMDRARADQMGMLATAINSLALEETFNGVGLKSRSMMVMEVNSFADPYRIRDARRHLDEGEVVIIGGGTGMPFFSTDTAAAIHAAEIGADVILMAKNIDGIYTADPHVDPTAKRYDEITYREILDKELKALDITASAFCMENNINCYAFELKDPMNIYKVIMGEKIGTELHR